MKAMEATAMDLRAVALAATREVGRCHGRICSQKNRDLFATMDEDSKLRKRERRKERRKEGKNLSTAKYDEGGALWVPRI
jgi:hypothetical protein